MAIKIVRKVTKIRLGGKDFGKVMFMLPEISEFKEVEIIINEKELHGSAISNAKQHSSHDRAGHKFASTNEGKNEGLPGLTTSALQ